MSKYNPNKFIEVLSRKINNRIPPCPFCGGIKFTSTPEYANINLSDEIGNIKIGTSIPAGIVVCENCGHIEFFALGALKMLNDKEESNDGK